MTAFPDSGIDLGEMRHPAQVRRAVKQCGMSDLVVEKGYLSPSDFQAAIQASDFVINRYPTVGESSGTMTRAMGLGKPVVVSARVLCRTSKRCGHWSALTF